MSSDEQGPSQEALSRTLVDLDAARRGDEDAANRLWDRYYEKLVPAVRIRLGSKLRKKVETMDIVQSVFLEAVSAAEKREFASEGHFRSWLSRLVENRIRKKARDFHRQRRDMDRERPFFDAQGGVAPTPKDLGPRPVSIVEQFDEIEKIEDALERVPEQTREVLVMRFFDELSYGEIGQRIDRSEEAARKIVNRAVGMLAREMERPPS